MKVRKGITLIEMLMVFAVMGIVVAVGIPKFAGMTDRAAVSSARDQVLAALNVARNTAVRRAATTTFNASGNEMWVTVDSAGTEVTILAKVNLNTLNKTALTTSGNAGKVQYNMRGLASNASGKIFVTRNGRSDSLCVTNLGAVVRKACPA